MLALIPPGPDLLADPAGAPAVRHRLIDKNNRITILVLFLLSFIPAGAPMDIAQDIKDRIRGPGSNGTVNRLKLGRAGSRWTDRIVPTRMFPHFDTALAKVAVQRALGDA